MPRYFAYGSNMLYARLHERVPSVRLVGVARLPGFALCWHKAGQDQSGKCDVVPVKVPGAVVHGVLYDVPADEKPLLDAFEGLGKGYVEARVTVVRDGVPTPAFLYRATAIDATRRPYTWYRALVVAGARQHALPEACVRAMEAVEAIVDPDAARHARNMALAARTDLPRLSA